MGSSSQQLIALLDICSCWNILSTFEPKSASILLPAIGLHSHLWQNTQKAALLDMAELPENIAHSQRASIRVSLL